MGVTHGRPVEASLVLTDDARRWLAAEPREITVGAIRMQGWQVHPVRPRPVGFAGQDAYLIKVNYDLMLEPGVPAPRWFEVGLALSCPGGAGPVAVLNAEPSVVLEPRAATAYTVSEYLSLIASARGIQLPAMAPYIDAFGIGGDEIRWRHTSGVRPGSYAALIVLVTPEGCGEAAVGVSARFDLGPADSLGLLPSDVPASFRLPLTEPPGAESTAPAGAVPVTPTGSPPTPAAPRPRVFVSYTHDDTRHKDLVRAFSEFLVQDCGLDVHLDRWDTELRRDWYEWAIDQITRADFVLVIASPMCKQVGDGQVPGGRHRGMQSEIALIREHLHSDRPKWRAKLLPVVLPGRSVDEIPVFLQPQTADHYLVTDWTTAGAEYLLRAITGQPPYLRPPINPQVVSLPPHPLARDANS
jgi:SEFIR domain